MTCTTSLNRCLSFVLKYWQDDYFVIHPCQGKLVSMKQPVIILLLILMALRVPAQQKHTAVYFDDSRTKTKEKLAQYLKFYGMQGEVKETDSTIALRAGLPGAKPVTFTYFLMRKVGSRNTRITIAITVYGNTRPTILQKSNMNGSGSTATIICPRPPIKCCSPSSIRQMIFPTGCGG